MKLLAMAIASPLFFLAAAALALGADKASPPNIVIIVADDLGRADVGFMGSQEIKTPNLDKLATGGAILDAFYVQPVCSPTRAALMTGRYPTHTGVYSVVRPNAPWGLPLAERTLAAALQETGYHTAISGKWHLGEFQKEYLPTHRGFDRQYGHYFGALDFFTKLRDGKRDWYRDDQPSDDEGYATHLLAREACRMIRDKPKDKPLFLYVPFNAVHAPYQVPEEYTKAYPQLSGTRKTYAGMVTAMDEGIGQIVAALDESGIRKNTLILFTSDNGGPAPGTITDNTPLRAGKGTVYEGGVRVCACVNWSGKVPSGSVVKEPVHVVDWFPTLVKLSGAKAEQKLPLDGLDVWPVIMEGAKTPHDAILLCAQVNRVAIRVGDWKLLVNAGLPAYGEANAKGAKKGKKAKQKAAGQANLDSSSIQLYNLATDIGETRNLASQEPERVKELRAKLDALLADAVKPGDKK